MKEVYIVLTRTGTILSRIIKMYTRDEFTHSSIALDRELNEMYSFGRLNPYNAFIGGFVHEYIHSGTFKRFYKTVARVYSLEVTDEQYKKARETIYEIERDKKKYKFNSIGVFAVGFGKKVRRNQYFYCAEFVKHILEKAEINVKLPDLIKPESFKELSQYGAEEIYNGLLQKYPFQNVTN